MSLNFDYLFSSSLSLLLHGAVGVGLYGAVVSGPQIDFQSGNGGIDISIVSPTELQSSLSSSQGTVARQSAQTQTSLPQTKADVALSPVVSRIAPQSVAQIVPVRSVSARAQTAPLAAPKVEPESSQPCGGFDCGSRSSLGRSGDAGVSSVGLVRAPKPPYPWAARRAGFEGQVVVAVEVTKDGSVRAAELAKSSGREDCDQAAVKTIRDRWHFEPARVNGQPVDWREKIVIVYDLQN